MSEYQYRKLLLAAPAIEGEDLLIYGIKKIKEKFKIIEMDKINSPELKEWKFLYNGYLNKIYIEKDENKFVFTGDVSPEILAFLKKIWKKDENKNE